MIRRLLIPLFASGLLLAGTAGSALGKCEEGADPMPEFCNEVVASLNYGSGGSLQAGEDTSILVSISKGEQPFEATGVVLTFVSAADGSRLQATATAATQPGNWRAEIILPDKGILTVLTAIEGADGEAYLIEGGRIRVNQPPEVPPVQTPATPPVTPSTPALPIALVLAGIAAAAIGSQVVRDRSRRRAGAPQPTGSTAMADRA